MMSRVEAKARELLAEGRRLSKYDLVSLAFCHQRVAQRILKKIHSEKLIRVVAWTKIHHTPIPVYAQSAGPNARRPKPVTAAEKARKYHAKPDVRERNINKKRAMRLIQRNPHDVLKADPFGVFYRSVDQRADRVLD